MMSFGAFNEKPTECASGVLMSVSTNVARHEPFASEELNLFEKNPVVVVSSAPTARQPFEVWRSI